jgi:hypothetical protein
MFHLLQVLTLVFVAVALSTALAHALEMPGKMRLTREAYLAVQPIYYPGFTIGGGIGEVGALILTLVVLLLTPSKAPVFWLTLTALLCLVGMEAVYWIRIHPVNKHWLQGQNMSATGSRFFSIASDESSLRGDGLADWTALRDRWEYSHVIRAGLAAISFLMLLTAVTSAA